MKVEIYGIYTEDLFKWLILHVYDSCGDGCGTVVCRNYKEAFQEFVKWAREKYKFFDSYKSINEIGSALYFHDNNENFIFTDIVPDKLDNDYVFIVREATSVCGKVKISLEAIS